MTSVLFHSTNKYASNVTFNNFKEQYEPVKQVMKQIKYIDHNWVICVDLKMVNFLLGQKSGYTKFSCFLCLWDNRAKDQHYVKWPLRTKLNPGDKKVIDDSLFPSDKIVFHSLLIKLGLMKKFVKVLEKEGKFFEYLCKPFQAVWEMETFDGLGCTFQWTNEWCRIKS